MKVKTAGTITNKKGQGPEAPALVKTEYGFYQYDPLPSRVQMQEYYAEQYFQEAKGSYEITYTPGELDYLKLRANLIYREWGRLSEMDPEKHVLDIGCGEGWFMDSFRKKGHAVTGMDYSEFGLKKFNPHLLPHFEQGDYSTLIAQKAKGGQKYDFIVLANVIEHVVDPVDLLEGILGILGEQGLLTIIAPNDFSALHKYLLDKNIIDKPFWLGYPDHLSYFNKESMENLLKAKGYQLETVVAENPVDNNLLNRNSNYIREPEKGKNIHHFRAELDNFLGRISEDKLLDIYESFGSMGVGRNLVYFCSKP